MKKVLLTIAVLFTAASISLACSEQKKACCKKGEKKACAASKDEKSCSKAKACCKKKGSSETAVAAPVQETPAK